MCYYRKYPYPSHRRFFSLNPSRNSILVSYFPSKNRAFETPLPLGISINLPWGGHGYFLELHIISLNINLIFYFQVLCITNDFLVHLFDFAKTMLCVHKLCRLNRLLSYSRVYRGTGVYKGFLRYGRVYKLWVCISLHRYTRVYRFSGVRKQ